MLDIRNQVLLGDGIEGIKSIPKGSVDLVFTDPPFGLSFTGKPSNYNRKRSLVVGHYKDWSPMDYYKKTNSWVASATTTLKTGGTLVVISGWNRLADIENAAIRFGLTQFNHIIWKYQFGVYTKNTFVNSHYHILFYSKGKTHTFNRRFEDTKKDYADREDVWLIKKPYQTGKLKTPNKLPEELVEKVLFYVSNQGDLVLDPFTGSETIPKVAKRISRDFLAFEVDPETHKYAVRNVYEDNLV